MLYWFLWTKTSMYYMQVGQIFHNLLVIIINFEVDYLLNRWSYRNTGGLVGSEFFISSNFYYWQKLIRPTVREIANLWKAVSPYYLRLSLILSNVNFYWVFSPFWACFHIQKDRMFIITRALFIIIKKDDLGSVESHQLISICLQEIVLTEFIIM